ncbi:MAG: CoA pyrophosphatase [Bacillota bacterium]
MKPTKISMDYLQSTFKNRMPSHITPMRQFGILALLTEIDGEFHFVLNKRAKNIHQGGDICFPGGRQENEESIEETALRETMEELGIDKKEIQMIGACDYFIHASRRMLCPFLGYVPYKILQNATYNKEEVEEVFTVPVSFFQETKPEYHTLHFYFDKEADFPFDKIEGGTSYPIGQPSQTYSFYFYEQHTIWGITAKLIESIISIFEV